MSNFTYNYNNSGPTIRFPNMMLQPIKRSNFLVDTMWFALREWNTKTNSSLNRKAMHNIARSTRQCPITINKLFSNRINY